MVGILPLVAKVFQVTVAQAGWSVSIFFALGVAVAGLFMPAVFAGMNRKHAMLLVQAIFLCSAIWLQCRPLIFFQFCWPAA